MSDRSVAGMILKQVARRNRTRLFKRFRGHRDAPWMRPFEEDIIRDLLRAQQPMRCLELGGGMSTLQFPDLLPAKATWLTIEHDAAWTSDLRALVTRPGVTVRHVPPDDPGFSGDGDEKSFASYLAAGDRDGPFDLVFIDGRARAAAVARSAGILAPGGCVVLHDANRDAYLGSRSIYQYELLFRDRRAGARHPAGGVWIGSRDRDPATLLDVTLHRAIWAFYSGVGRLLA